MTSKIMKQKIKKEAELSKLYFQYMSIRAGCNDK